MRHSMTLSHSESRVCGWRNNAIPYKLAPQKVHCIYALFIANYTMVYLKWKACRVHGYMEYWEYNACVNSETTTTLLKDVLCFYLHLCVFCKSVSTKSAMVHGMCSNRAAHVRTLKHAGLQIGSVRSRVQLPNKDYRPHSENSHNSIYFAPIKFTALYGIGGIVKF